MPAQTASASRHDIPADRGGDSAAAAAARRIAKPWGEELILGREGGELRKILRISAGRRLSLQYHRRKRETVTLLAGGAVLTIGEDAEHLRDLPLSAGEPVTIAPLAVHRFRAGGRGAVLLEVATDAPDEAEDVIRLADDYGRADAAG